MVCRQIVCPNDDIEMRQVKAESHYGQSFFVDQCLECGGIWFDKSELYLAKQGQAEKIELLDTENLRTPCDIKNTDLLCPQDHLKLIIFSDPYFPKDLVIARCPQCDGLWLNRGEFKKYQSFRQEKRRQKEKSSADIQFEQDIARILDKTETGSTLVELGRLGSFLSTPLNNSTWQPMEPHNLSEEEQTALNLIIGALRTILNILIFR
jgi:Zn-finger nucleic acid-binding protein